MLYTIQRYRRSLTALLLTLSLLSLTGASSCSKEKVATKALKASQDIQLSTNSFLRVLKTAQDQGSISKSTVDLYKPFLKELIDNNEKLNNKAIEWSRSSTPLPTEAKQTFVDFIDSMLTQLSEMDTLTSLHVKNPQSLRSIRLLLSTMRTTLNGVSLLIISGKGGE